MDRYADGQRHCCRALRAYGERHALAPVRSPLPFAYVRLPHALRAARRLPHCHLRIARRHRPTPLPAPAFLFLPALACTPALPAHAVLPCCCNLPIMPRLTCSHSAAHPLPTTLPSSCLTCPAPTHTYPLPYTTCPAPPLPPAPPPPPSPHFTNTFLALPPYPYPPPPSSPPHLSPAMVLPSQTHCTL